MQSFFIQSTDRVEVQAYSWLPANQPVAVLQIAHGMQEHARRYDHFAGWMNERGIAVYAEDHIGHGLSAKNENELSHWPRKDDWHRSVDILHNLTLKIKTAHPGIPVILLGHSMGSVLAQTYMIRYGNEADGFILSGAIRQPAFMAYSGQILASMLSSIYGPDDRSGLLVKSGYGQYNKHFKPNRTGADWLCSVDKVVDDYIESPLCGKRLTNRFYQNLTYGFGFIAKSANLAKIPSGKPVSIIAGKSDPAGFFGKAPIKIKELLEQHANAKVDLKLYPGCRHEILNEKNREEVYNDVLSWMVQIIEN
jgi:alpha-beta hydrolase superfamily lysophospholipase